MRSDNSIKLGNRDFELERSMVPLGFLRLDSENQRLSFLLKRANLPTSDEQLHALLWEMDAVKDLYNSILQNGGLINDPLVKRNGLVVEGNCRTVCLRELHRRFPEDLRWQSVNVQLLPESATDEQLAMLIGELHIAGKIEWRAFEQAEYVWKMNKLYGKTHDFLAAHVRWSRSKLQQKIAAYEETKVYLEATGDPEGINRFSHFEELMKKKELRDKREDDPGFMEDFRTWVREGRFPDAKDVRELPDILTNEAALNAFTDGGAVAARQVLQQRNPALVSSLWATVDRAISELRGAPLLEIEDLQRRHPAKLEKLEELRAAIDTVKRHAGLD